MKNIIWKNDGWTVIQDADAKKHLLEISCFAENGKVTEIRKRHNDGEEEVIKTKIDDTHRLPMSLDDLKAAVESSGIEF